MKINRKILRRLILETLIKESDYKIQQQSTMMKPENLPTEEEATVDWVIKTGKEAREKAQDVKLEHMLSRGIRYDMNSDEFIITTKEKKEIRIPEDKVKSSLKGRDAIYK